MTELLHRPMVPTFFAPADPYRMLPRKDHSAPRPSPQSYEPRRLVDVARVETAPRPKEVLHSMVNKGQNQNTVAQWLAGTIDTPPQGTQSAPTAIPMAMNGAAANQMLAPSYVGLYNHHGVAKANTASYQSNVDLSGGRAPEMATAPTPGSSSRPTSPSKGTGAAHHPTTRRRSSGGDNQIVSYLQIPQAINNSKGSLAEFAAQITCLFWFESSFTLHRVEESKVTPTPTTPLVLEALPTMGFRKWVTTILSTTQVTQNVILLALMFIYRLKKLNPTVKGKPGSEFRLLTVALMLGNKFLDDNTYTNKTWAEVSGISVQEIHIMEVEFLSNMRYTLYVSEREWALWHQKLGRFWDYFDKASKSPIEGRTLGQSTPNPNVPLSLPSPPPSLYTSPPFGTNRFSSSFDYRAPASLSLPLHLAPTLPTPMIDGNMPVVDLRPNLRKRSYDEPMPEPASKRVATSHISEVPPSLTNASTPSSFTTPRLPIPNLSVSTNGHLSMYPGSYSAQLPFPTGRAMSSVYPGNPLYPKNLPTPSHSAGPYSTLPPMNEQHRRAPNSGSRTASPTIGSFQQSTQDSLSPSGYLIQRSSPYKPLRSVNTLLVPPPSASLHNPSQNVGLNNMHYRPIGKPLSESKTGVVPYLHQDPWQQVSHASQWPALPQPNLPQTNFRF